MQFMILRRESRAVMCNLCRLRITGISGLLRLTQNFAYQQELQIYQARYLLIAGKEREEEDGKETNRIAFNQRVSV